MAVRVIARKNRTAIGRPSKGDSLASPAIRPPHSPLALPLIARESGPGSRIPAPTRHRSAAPKPCEGGSLVTFRRLRLRELQIEAVQFPTTEVTAETKLDPFVFDREIARAGEESVARERPVDARRRIAQVGQ
jgi:hypothetical protein